MGKMCPWRMDDDVPATATRDDVPVTELDAVPVSRRRRRARRGGRGRAGLDDDAVPVTELRRGAASRTTMPCPS